jgi:uncharacterized C2H2 Zn-finger protein
MARARRQSTTKPAETQTQSAEFTCPECGKTFTRAASLGAHRNRAHGVAGTSKSPRTPSGRRASRATANRQTRTANASRPRRASGDGTSTRVDRDALLQQLFPNGLPAREAVIRAANEWLDQAEQLAKLK